MSEPLVRSAGVADADALALLEKGSFPHPWNAAQLAAELRPPSGVGLIAEEPAGKIVGFALFRVLLDQAELLRLAVEPATRRQGLARTLARRGLAQLRATGVTTAFLEVRADNVPAIRFYESTGWEPGGRRPRYYPDGADALVYRCQV